MVRSSVLVALAATVSGAFGMGKLPMNGNTIVPGAYIIEFDGDQDAPSVMKAASVDENDVNTRMNLNYKLFKGVSVQFDDVETAEEKADRIAKLPAVKEIWPVQLYSIPKPRVEWIGSPETEHYSVSKKRRAINETSEDTFSPHVMTQVDKLRAKGITGKGIKIAVVDTGIDYGHPALGGCFGPDCLVSFGTDLAGDAYTGFNTPQPDDDPMDCQGHGTHVAGTIAAQKNAFGFTGAAPDVTLGAYRVFGCDGEAANDVLIAAFNQAYEDGADIITASIGGPSGWSEDPWAVAVSRIVDQGVPCTVSAGNSGDQGLFYASTAANGKGVTAIASFDNIMSPALLTVSHFIVGGKREEFGYTPGEPAAWGGVKLPLWTPGSSNVNGCDEYPANTDLSGNIVLAQRGSCTFVQKAQNAAKAGAKYLILYNNAPGTGSFDVKTVSGILAVGMVTTEQGQAWVSLLEKGTEVVLDMADPKGAAVTLLQVANKASGGALSDFTSWGPTWEMDVKPQFGTPGGSILSTYPRALGSYAVLSGTSMACPLAAAIVALIAQVRGTFDPALIENLMSANANPQLFNDKVEFYDFLAPVPQQGGGLVRAYDAAYAKTLLSPSSISFNDTEHFVESRNFTLKNTGSEDVTYQISHVPAITMNTLVANSIYPDQFVNEPTTQYASLQFSESKVTIGAGESVVIEVLPTPPESLNAERLPVWSGYVAINGTDGSSLSLPYQGLTGALHDHVVLGPQDTHIARSNDKALTAVPANTTFTLPPPGTANASGYILPDLTWGLALGSRLLRADIIPLLTGRGDGKNCGTNHTVPIYPGNSIGQPDTFPMRWNPRGINHHPWAGELADGSYAKPGLYKIKFSALRIFGDEKKKEDWDVSETTSFRIQYGS